MSKKRTFLHGMVEGTFHDFSSYKRELDAQRMAQDIRQQTGYGDVMVRSYAERLQYTINLAFNWTEEAPAHWRSFEQWWNMLQSGNHTDGECYDFAISNIDIAVLNEWADAYLGAIQAWKPAGEAMPEEGDEEKK